MFADDIKLADRESVLHDDTDSSGSEGVRCAQKALNTYDNLAGQLQIDVKANKKSHDEHGAINPVKLVGHMGSSMKGVLGGLWRPESILQSTDGISSDSGSEGPRTTTTAASSSDTRKRRKVASLSSFLFILCWFLSCVFVISKLKNVLKTRKPHL